MALQQHGKHLRADEPLGADANVYAAWQLDGQSDVTVAAVDQGVKYDHEDLAANMWGQRGRTNGTPGVDDDGNGYVDDIYGYNFTRRPANWISAN